MARAVICPGERAAMFARSILIRRRILSDLRILIQLDPDAKSEFLERMEKRLWEVRVEQAREDIFLVARLMETLYGRLTPLQKKYKKITKDTSQIELF
jgi:hypothetical protein